MDSQDKSFSVGETPCPVADNMVPPVDDDPAVQQLFVDYKDLLNKVRVAINDSLATFKDVYAIFDAVSNEMGYFGDSYKKPEWMDDQTLKMLDVFHETSFSLSAKLPKTYFRYKSGPFFKELLTNLNLTTDNGRKLSTNEKQLFLYASHDTIISHILQTIHFYKGIIQKNYKLLKHVFLTYFNFLEVPRFCSGLILELRTNPLSPSSSPLVHLFYSNVTETHELYQLPLNNSPIFSAQCIDKTCSLDNFSASFQDLLPENIEEECKNENR